MGSLNPFKKPKQDTSAIEAQEKRIKEQEEKLAAEEKQKKATLNARKARSGKNSLLSGLETGVTAVDDEKRGSLG